MEEIQHYRWNDEFRKSPLDNSVDADTSGGWKMVFLSLWVSSP